jgi:hypothetical protein
MLTRRLSVFDEEPYLALVKILREADAAFTNMETTVHEYNKGTPGLTRGTYQALMALVNVNLLPKGSATDMSLVPQGICSIPGRAYL